MERDFRKLTSWVEEMLQVGVVEENNARERKLTEKSLVEKSESAFCEQTKAD
jgi:hypothetical protein